jgi:hypothetical protein
MRSKAMKSFPIGSRAVLVAHDHFLHRGQANCPGVKADLLGSKVRVVGSEAEAVYVTNERGALLSNAVRACDLRLLA